MDAEKILKEAQKILNENRMLLRKYPDKFSLRMSVKQWSYKVSKLERELEESKVDKYLMSSKTLDMWIECTGENTYKDRPIEIDDSIPYGAVDNIKR